MASTIRAEAEGLHTTEVIGFLPRANLEEILFFVRGCDSALRHKEFAVVGRAKIKVIRKACIAEWDRRKVGA